jgi:hypothetical protein
MRIHWLQILGLANRSAEVAPAVTAEEIGDWHFRHSFQFRLFLFDLRFERGLGCVSH